jgi:hypothetical protein
MPGANAIGKLATKPMAMVTNYECSEDLLAK